MLFPHKMLRDKLLDLILNDIFLNSLFVSTKNKYHRTNITVVSIRSKTQQGKINFMTNIFMKMFSINKDVFYL